MGKKSNPAQDAPSLQVAEAGDSGGPGAPSDLAAMTGDILPARVEAPSIIPESETAAIANGEDQGITAWHNSKKITALWCNSSNRNAYAAVEGLGWRRLSNANDGAHLNLAILASHAEQTGSNCNIRVETNNMIQEMYVW